MLDGRLQFGVLQDQIVAAAAAAVQIGRAVVGRRLGAAVRLVVDVVGDGGRRLARGVVFVVAVGGRDRALFVLYVRRQLVQPLLVVDVRRGAGREQALKHLLRSVERLGYVLLGLLYARGASNF